jgi:hypothetical protein
MMLPFQVGELIFQDSRLGMDRALSLRFQAYTSCKVISIDASQQTGLNPSQMMINAVAS